MPKMNMYSNGNILYEFLSEIRKNTVITTLGKYHLKSEHVIP